MSSHPTTDEVLGSILWTFENQITPAIDDDFAVSAARTVTNLLRHVRARVQLEGKGLAEDNAELRAVLGAVQIHPEVGPLMEVAAVLDAPPVAPEPWPSVEALVDEAERLRLALDAVVRSGVVGSDASLAARVDGYMARHLGREAQWAVDPFIGDRR
ncbi:hypothetical protein [Ilumatobacter coccineus]|uniref:hypothetical protein n=1 Tax=Ilumatobacter coccineus TaxID=467094 RepID=UPI00034C02C0|nr:hypothetical protein [Ilumatobacter coccineus]